MRIPVFTLLFIIFLIVLSFKRNQHTKKQNHASDSFLMQESTANATRRKDISTLDYVVLDLDALPIGKYNDDSLAEYEHTLTQLADKKILNLSNKTNTELKLLYGPANLETLTEYDENFLLLAKTLVSYANQEEDSGHTHEAISILEYGMSIQSDISKNYLLLAKLYEKVGTPEKLSYIQDALLKMDASLAAPIKDKLNFGSLHPSGHIG